MQSEAMKQEEIEALAREMAKGVKTALGGLSSPCQGQHQSKWEKWVTA